MSHWGYDLSLYVGRKGFCWVWTSGSQWYVTAAEMHEGRLHVTKSAQTYHDAVLVRSPISTSVVTWVGIPVEAAAYII